MIPSAVYDLLDAPTEQSSFIPPTIRKRDGRIVSFDPKKIYAALEKCFRAEGAWNTSSCDHLWELTGQVVNAAYIRGQQPTVETIQDLVELSLQMAGEYKAAKHYILYRAEHAKARELDRIIPPEVRAAYESSSQYFQTP